jgi:hypothetical protein
VSMHFVPKVDDNFQLVEAPGMAANVRRIRRDFVEPVPVGTLLACVFRVTGYDRDFDGSAMVRLEQIDQEGQPSGWEPTNLDLAPDSWVVLDTPNDLHSVAK